MLFLEVILLSTLSKMSNNMIKPRNCAWDPTLLDSVPLNYVKKSGSKALLKIPPNSSFLYFPLVYSLFRDSFHSLNLLWYGLNPYQSSRPLILILYLLCLFLSMGVINFMLCPIKAGSNSTCSIDHIITISFTPSVGITYE